MGAGDLSTAPAALDKASGEERGLLSQWEQPWLDGYRANVYLLTRQPRLAEEVNTTALARLDPSLLYQRSALLSDIARAQIGQGAMDRACATLGEALELARRQGAQVRLQHVVRARAQMGNGVASVALRHLDEKLQPLRRNPSRRQAPG